MSSSSVLSPSSSKTYKEALLRGPELDIPILIKPSELDKLQEVILTTTTSPRDSVDPDSGSKSGPNSARSARLSVASTDSYSVNIPRRKISGTQSTKQIHSASHSPRTPIESPRSLTPSPMVPSDDTSDASGDEFEPYKEEVVKMQCVPGLPPTRAASYSFSWGGHYTGCWVNGRVGFKITFVNEQPHKSGRFTMLDKRYQGTWHWELCSGYGTVRDVKTGNAKTSGTPSLRPYLGWRLELFR